MLLNHFANGKMLVATFEGAISPPCQHLGFRTDLAVERVLDGTSLLVEQQERMKPLGMWRHLVLCVNRKNGPVARAVR